MTRKCLVFATLALMITLTAGAADGRWVNVHVTEPSSNTEVNVHLPLNLVLSVVGAVDVDSFAGGKIQLHTEDVDIDWPEVLASIKDAADGEYVVVHSDDADVNVSKKNNTLLITVNQKTEEKAKVEVVLPAQIMDAIHVDDDDQIDVAALLKAFSDLPGGDLVRVTSDDANVRVWVE